MAKKVTKRKVPKGVIIAKILLELDAFGVNHPHTLALAKRWLNSKWVPMLDGHISIPLNWHHWKTSTVEWEPKGAKVLVIRNDPNGSLKIWSNGARLYSDTLTQAWQDRLSLYPQNKANEAIGAKSLFNLDGLNKSNNKNIERGYTHEDA